MADAMSRATPGALAAAPAAAPLSAAIRVVLADGAETTVHLRIHDAAATELRVAVLPGCQRLAAWCAVTGVREALVGGFFTRPRGIPLGEVRTHGVARRHVPFDAPWDMARACVHVDGGRPRIALRDEIERAPRGDLLQAGPLLVRGGVPVYDRAGDPEGFSAGARQFDSDITAARHPRAALGIAPGRLVALACDGRAAREAGLTLEELARVMAGLGCETALNLDGGGSASLVAGGVLRNTPRGTWEQIEPGGRPVATALVFAPR